jgi:hypothetical protein
MTTWLKVKNNAASELASAITDSDTGLTLKTGEASRFPSSFPFHITIDDEILEVTAITDDTLTVTRAQESTSAATHNAGASVRLNITSALFEELQTEIDAKEPALPLTTKGDLLAFAAALTRLPVGDDGQFLAADSGEDAGMKWQELAGGVVISTGTYSGDNNDHRAIPHGLGVVPKIVFIQSYGDAGSTNAPRYIGTVFNYSGSGKSKSAAGVYAETALDATNFYVSNSTYVQFNDSGFNYYWVAIA